MLEELAADEHAPLCDDVAPAERVEEVEVVEEAEATEATEGDPRRAEGAGALASAPAAFGALPAAGEAFPLRLACMVARMASSRRGCS